MLTQRDFKEIRELIREEIKEEIKGLPSKEDLYEGYYKRVGTMNNDFSK